MLEKAGCYQFCLIGGKLTVDDTTLITPHPAISFVPGERSGKCDDRRTKTIRALAFRVLKGVRVQSPVTEVRRHFVGFNEDRAGVKSVCLIAAACRGADGLEAGL
ncbi:hypothetical protein COCON_G00108090 [Conger conger]|uniref:Uncharacterized protein n=1 Tax=Conger conger TaxID=82655 RepID=A0A9Q1HZU8_CONCO|nr:hypothetical protein COCON_G00108090 [Conger conger]